MDEDSRPHVTSSSDMFWKNPQRVVTCRKKCSLSTNLKCAPTGSPEKPFWLYSSCSKPARESRPQCGILTDLAKKKKKRYRNVSPKTKSNSGKERERQQRERQLRCSTNSANYTGMDSFITQLRGCSLIASICSSLGLSEITLFQSSQSCCLHSFS